MLLHQPLGEWMLGHPMTETTTPSSGSHSPLLILAGILGIILISVAVAVAWKIYSRALRRFRRGADRRPGRSWVQGTAQIVSVHVLHAGRNSGPNGEPSKYQLDLVLTGAGVTPTAVRVDRWVKSPIWPDTRMIVPVLIDPADPKNFAFLWDDLPPTAADTGEQRAHDLEARLRAASAPTDRFVAPTGMLARAAAAAASSPSPTPDATPSTPSAPRWNVGDGLASPLPTGSGRRLIVTGMTDVPPADALKALTALHDRGFLTDAEFAEQTTKLSM
ncbi:MAG: hypothetical protein JWQ19_2263 [Subtercola sp.]|nr:hypothetical protein [Subtercola sp.]